MLPYIRTYWLSTRDCLVCTRTRSRYCIYGIYSRNTYFLLYCTHQVYTVWYSGTWYILISARTLIEILFRNRYHFLPIIEQLTLTRSHKKILSWCYPPCQSYDTSEVHNANEVNKAFSSGSNQASFSSPRTSSKPKTKTNVQISNQETSTSKVHQGCQQWLLFPFQGPP